jgi:hypothetical protein
MKKDTQMKLVAALDNLCGEGAQFEHACDAAEHDYEGNCIWCEARVALKNAKR